jgi:hypothetical protein
MTQQSTAVADGKVVGIYYTLKDEQGQVLDTNRRGGKPLAFLQGKGNILPALERAGRRRTICRVTLAPGWGTAVKSRRCARCRAERSAQRRRQARHALQRCRSQGARTVLVTGSAGGDHR